MFKIGFENGVKKDSVTASKMWSKNDSANIKFVIEYPRKFILSVMMKRYGSYWFVSGDGLI